MKKSYREYKSVVIIGIKKNNEIDENFTRSIEQSEQNNFFTFIPFVIINDLYNTITDKSSKKLTGVANLIYESELFFKTKKGEKATQKLKKIIGNKNYFKLIQTFKHAPFEKICFEYSKTCYHMKKFDEVEKVCENLIKIMNLDWRVVFSTYFLLAKINFDLKNFNKARKYNLLSLKANPKFSLSKKLMKKIEKKVN